MNSGDKLYIWQQDTWPKWTYAHTRLAPLLAQVHRAQGLLLGRMHDIGLEQRDQATLRVLTEDVIKTSEIEGEMLNPESVRIVRGYVEPSAATLAPETSLQFERLGFFTADRRDHAPGRPVFNRTVTLRDTWAKK